MNEDQPQEIIQQHNLYQIPMQVEKNDGKNDDDEEEEKPANMVNQYEN